MGRGLAGHLPNLRGPVSRLWTGQELESVCVAPLKEFLVLFPVSPSREGELCHEGVPERRQTWRLGGLPVGQPG